MLFYRLVNPLHDQPGEWLAGTGGLFGSARWHSKGQRIVYLAPTKANAVVEMACQDSQLASYVLIEVEIPDAVAREAVEVSTLPLNWRSRAAYSACQKIGSDWHTASRTALLVVPSAPVAGDFNILVNPLHADAARLTAKRIGTFPMDSRLITSNFR